VRGSELAAGWDLASAVDIVVPARGKKMVTTDIAIATPTDCYARVAPRSGLAYKKSIDVGAGVVDADYRGPVGVILFNHSDDDFDIKVGDRIAQLILEKVHLDVDIEKVDELPETNRGTNGFGSTGVDEPIAKKARPVSPPLATDYNDLLEKYNTLEARLKALEQAAPKQ